MRSTDMPLWKVLLNHLHAGSSLLIPTDISLPAFTVDANGKILRHFPRWCAIRVAILPTVQEVVHHQTWSLYRHSSIIAQSLPRADRSGPASTT